MRVGALALATFTRILAGESVRRKNEQISTGFRLENRCAIDGSDCDLSGDAGSFRQRPAFAA